MENRSRSATPLIMYGTTQACSASDNRWARTGAREASQLCSLEGVDYPCVPVIYKAPLFRPQAARQKNSHYLLLIHFSNIDSTFWTFLRPCPLMSCRFPAWHASCRWLEGGKQALEVLLEPTCGWLRPACSNRDGMIKNSGKSVKP